MARIFDNLRPKGITYEIWLTDDAGNRLDSLTNKVHNFTAIVGGMGDLSITLPFDYPWTTLGFGNPVALDRRIEIWRGANNTRASLIPGAVYFLRDIGLEIKRENALTVTGGPGPSDLLHRRIVAYNVGSSQAVKDDLADDMMKEIVRENLGGSATDPDRDITALDFSIQADAGAGPNVKHTINRNWVDDTLDEIAKKARIEGTRVYYSVVPVTGTNGLTAFEFQTWIDQPGQDLTDSKGLVFSWKRGNLLDPKYKKSYRNTINYVYTGGQGEQGTRNVRAVSDPTRIAYSRYNRREGWADASDVISGSANEDAEIDSRGNAVLRDGQPELTFSTDIIDTDNARFGVDWNQGDRVPVNFVEQFEVVIDRIRIRVGRDGKETIEAKTEWVA
jgi:hypothetical protein